VSVQYALSSTNRTVFGADGFWVGMVISTYNDRRRGRERQTAPPFRNLVAFS
jgi:hypothetical protein